jgi:hypothetical protein
VHSDGGHAELPVASSDATFSSSVARHLEHMRLEVGDPSAWFAYSGDKGELGVTRLKEGAHVEHRRTTAS